MNAHADVVDVEVTETQRPVMKPASQALAEPQVTAAPMAATASESAAIFQIIERAARDPNVDIDKMQRLMEMRDRELARMAQVEFNKAMSAAQAEMKPVARDADNDQTKSKYARYETISEAIQPFVAKHGFALTFSEGTPAKENCIRTVCEVMHSAGHTKEYYADVPFDNVGMKGNANKTNTHAYGSTKSYGKRYLKCDIFDVALKNEDDDGNNAGDAPELISEEQAALIRRLIEETETDIEKFCGWAKIEAIPDLHAKNFQKVVEVLNQRRKSA